MFKYIIGTGAIALALAAGPVAAADHVVEMKNKGDAGPMVFEPALISVAVGDTVTFKATDKGHDAASIEGLMPAGAEAFNGELSKDVTVTFTVPGVYAIQCTPHYVMGMVALVVVDNDLSNLPAIKEAKFPKLAAKRFDAMLAELGAQ